jgi:adenylate cyclase
MNVVTLLTGSDLPMTARGTFLFTDIVNSTGTAEAVGDERWAQVLRSHNRLIRDAVEMHDGEECAFLGDGFLILFADAHDAYECAVAIQRLFGAFGELYPDASIKVRIGLHCGTACREGTDVYGRSVHLASRIAGEADGGEILISACAHEQLAASLPPRCRFREVALKGLEGTHRLFSVRPLAVALAR